MPYKTLITLILCYSFFDASANRLDEFTGDWINGSCTYHGSKVAPDVLQFEGGSLHEGGYQFTIVAKNDSTFFIGGRKWPETEEDKKYGPEFGQRDNSVICKRIGGVKVMIVFMLDGSLRDFLCEAKPGEDLREDVLNNKARYELAGKYIDSATRKPVIFYADKRVADGLTNAKDYTFETPYDMPDEVITFTNGKRFCYSATDSGLNIYAAVERGDDIYTAGRKLMSLKKVYRFDLSGNPALKGRYAFASTRILTHDILGGLTATQKRIIRNEIYARHGYIFRTADMKRYFETQDWYHPQFDTVDDQLTDIEKLNIQLLVRDWRLD